MFKLNLFVVNLLHTMTFIILVNLFVQEIDAALLAVISYPAFAVDDYELIDLTRDTITEKLMVFIFLL